MRDSFTAGATRALERATQRARERRGDLVEPADLLLALSDDEESRAASILAELGLGTAGLEAQLGVPTEIPAAEDATAEAPPPSADLRHTLAEATGHARVVDRNQPVGTEHLLAGLLSLPGTVSDLLRQAGLELHTLLDGIHGLHRVETEPIPLDAAISAPRLSDPGELADLARILDASSNRAREGLRVVEDYVRFVLDDPGLTRRLKEIRHRLTEAIRGFDPALLITSRDTPGDVGTHIMTASEATRGDSRSVLAANLKRCGEALRTLEEYTKLSDSWLAGRFEVLRYDVYTIEKRVMAAVAARQGLGDACFYVLVGGEPTLGTLTWVVEEAIAGGVQVIQLREKDRDDRELLTRAREVRIITAKAGVRFIMNDRPDLARLSGADGVHLGQDDMAVRDARRIVGPNALIGVSTHEPSQIEAAVRDGANYLGVGPVFESETKGFDSFAGLEFVRRAAEITSLPWFAIGGIHAENIADVIEAGATRVAVSGAVEKAERPRDAARELRQILDHDHR